MLPAEIPPTVTASLCINAKAITHMQNQLLRLVLSISVTPEPNR